MGSRPIDGLLNGTDLFMAMTDATIASGTFRQLERTVPVLAVRRGRAHVLFVADDENPDQLLAEVLDERTAALAAPGRGGRRLGPSVDDGRRRERAGRLGGVEQRLHDAREPAGVQAADPPDRVRPPRRVVGGHDLVLGSSSTTANGLAGRRPRDASAGREARSLRPAHDALGTGWWRPSSGWSGT